jgi:hypothetical protein
VFTSLTGCCASSAAIANEGTRPPSISGSWNVARGDAMITSAVSAMAQPNARAGPSTVTAAGNVRVTQRS